jgi:hypothetical protein
MNVPNLPLMFLPHAGLETNILLFVEQAGRSRALQWTLTPAGLEMLPETGFPPPRKAAILLRGFCHAVTLRGEDRLMRRKNLN